MLLRDTEPEKEPIMSIAKQLDPSHDREFSPVRDAHRDGPDHDSHERHQHHHSFSHAEHEGRLESSHAGFHEQHSGDHGGGLGWGPAAWGEAGGFEHVLGGGLAGPLAISPIDHLAASNDPSAHNFLTETTNILFDVSPGGAINIGGNVEAMASQSMALNATQSHDSGGFLHNAQIETTNIIFNVATGGTIDVGGSVEGLSSQFTALNATQSHDNGAFLHNTVVETTNIIFNVANGGVIDVGGNVEAASAQQIHVEPHAVADLAHLA
jgi:hypothetical protein